MTVIRPLTRHDASLVETLAQESEADGFRFVTRFLLALKTGALKLDDTHQYYLGVFDGNALIAIGGVSPDPYVDNSGVGRIRHVYVARDQRRVGIGRTLVDALETRARSKFPILRLRTDTSDAAAFYEAIGYQRTSEANATHRRTWSALTNRSDTTDDADVDLEF